MEAELADQLPANEKVIPHIDSSPEKRIPGGNERSSNYNEGNKIDNNDIMEGPIESRDTAIDNKPAYQSRPKSDV